MIELFILIACLIESRRGDSEYFDYQIYKVENEHEEATASKINITYQHESGGSMHQILASGYKVKGNEHELIGEEDNQRASYWRQKTYNPTISDEDENDMNLEGEGDTKKKKKKKAP